MTYHQQTTEETIGAREVPAAEVVPGDVVVPEAGKIVPADMQLIETANLRTERR